MFAWRSWWVVPEAMAAGGLLVALWLTPAAVPVTGPALTERVVAALERASPAEHHSHGHDVAVDERVACVAEIYGTDPPAARDFSGVRVIYAQFLCAAGGPGTPFELSSRISGPVAVSLGDPPVLHIPAPGDGYPERVRALLPDAYEAQALQGFRDPNIPAALRTRYLVRVATAS